jgi:hypothetical protein
MHTDIFDKLLSNPLTPSGQKLQRWPWNASLMQQPDSNGGNQGRLLGWLREYEIARSKRGTYLANEYCQREIPGTDADHGAER